MKHNLANPVHGLADYLMPLTPWPDTVAGGGMRIDPQLRPGDVVRFVDTDGRPVAVSGPGEGGAGHYLHYDLAVVRAVRLTNGVVQLTIAWPAEFRDRRRRDVPGSQQRRGLDPLPPRLPRARLATKTKRGHLESGEQT